MFFGIISFHTTKIPNGVRKRGANIRDKDSVGFSDITEESNPKRQKQNVSASGERSILNIRKGSTPSSLEINSNELSALALKLELYNIIRTVIPGSKLFMFGSSLNGAGTNFSDLDLCLVLHDEKDMLFEKFQDMVNYSVADTYQENLAKVELYYEEFNHERIEEKPSYELPQFLSDCGGILGLWLGMSVLTICEFLEFGMDLFFFGIWEGCKRKRKKTKVEDIRIEQDAPNAASLNMVNLKKNPMETSKKRASFVDSPFYIN
ncbi:hypothetical protein HELRODRAFT_163469 [Helobdella robusta]|uniref:Uncharacterized protein n=1 Tax=Helobdella robusta TaxID=6412 RepID=T1EU36_HELRO|nr:hypothetical protein HELRODRAFT_163469 [Helobdella robusta]ESN96408.1 hypothetical protein HELRODRAFT_163469 [Helobdella robusta]